MLPTALLAAFVLAPLDVPPKAAVRPRDSVRPMQGWAEQLRKCGMERRHAGRLDEALAAFNAALLLDPNSDSAYAGRGKTLTLLGRHTEAADDYARAIALAPNDWTNWLCVAEGWILRGRYDEAQRCFDHAAGLRPPGRWRCDVRLAEMIRWAGTETTAGGCDFSPYTVANASAERQCRAESAVIQALLLETDSTLQPRAELFGYRGMIRHGMGRHAEAIADYDRALAEVTTDAELHYYRAKLAHLQQDTSKALHHLDLAEQFGGERDGIVRLRAKIHDAAGEWEKAEACVAELCKLGPDDANLLRLHAILLWQLGRDDEAVATTDRLVTLAHTSVLIETCLQFSGLPHGNRDPLTSDRLLTRTLDRPDLTPFDRATLYRNRGLVRDSASRPDEAFDDYTRAVRLQPEQSGFRRERAEAALHQKRYAAAMEDAEALCRLEPHVPANWELLWAARGAEELAAVVAGRRPDYRPAGPVVRVPICLTQYDDVIGVLDFLRSLRTFPPDHLEVR